MHNVSKFNSLICGIGIFLWTACGTKKDADSGQASVSPVLEDAVSSDSSAFIRQDGWTFQVLDNSSLGKGFGYDIFHNGNLYIRQENIPGLPGIQGFSTAEKAGKTAELVINKIRNNEMPPSLSREEMQKAGVLDM